MEIRTIGGGGRLATCERVLSSLGRRPRFHRLLILPIPTSRDRVHITGTALPLPAVSELAGEGCLAAGYGIPNELTELLEGSGAEVLDLLGDEEFLTANARLSARGALGRILTDTAVDLPEMRVGLIGYGRIGSALLRMLLFLGARVLVLTGRAEVSMELASMGVESRLYAERGDLSDLDLIINTAPAEILTAQELSGLLSSVRIFDLASGNVIPPSPCVVKLASVPDAMYPISAGRLYAEFIARRAFYNGG